MMKIEARYAQVSDTSHGCSHEELLTIVDDGWQMIECARCKKHWAFEKRRASMDPVQIDVAVINVKPHLDQATNNPGTWAVKFRVARAGKVHTFWRWHSVRRFNANGALIEPDNAPPSTDEILAWFWDATFSELHGFDFDREGQHD